ncbi:lysis system i-spanin subunit Rz [Yersinia canariae]|uniref:lysis system i-spanin subunit Rz n=1 Tax=Yersinia canariae TaxID=2607663 RepID=UPI0011A60EA0
MALTKQELINGIEKAHGRAAVSFRWADSAVRDYFTLRERFEIAGKQIAGLQQYLNEQCRR